VPAKKTSVQKTPKAKPTTRSAVASGMPTGIKILLISAGVIFSLGIIFTIAASIIAGTYFHKIFGNSTVTVNQNGSVEIQGQDGKANFSSKAELPAEWPKDIPVYPGATVITSYAVKGDDQVVSVHFQTTDSAEKVVNYYKDNLAAQSWVPVDESGFFPIGTFGAAKKTDRKLSVIVIEDKKADSPSALINIAETKDTAVKPKGME